jgi:hypothetical protein
MAKTSLEKIASWDEEIAQIKNKQKLERQKHQRDERAARTRRLCSRHGLLESMMPEIVAVTDEQYKTFLERAVTNNYGRDILSKIIAQGGKAKPTNETAGAEQNSDKATVAQAKTAEPTADTANAKPAASPPQTSDNAGKSNGNHANGRSGQPNGKDHGTATV